MERMIRNTRAVVWCVLSLRLIVNPMVEKVSAAQQGFLSKRMSRVLTPRGVNTPESQAQSCPDPSAYVLVDQQVAQTVHPQQSEQEE